jgi:hypothetical protein
LHWIYLKANSSVKDKEFLEAKDRAGRILAQFYSWYDFYTPSFIDAASPAEQTDLVNSLTAHRSDKIDKAVYQVFRSSKQTAGTTDDSRILLDRLCFACIKRLAGKDHDEEFRSYLSERKKAVEALPKDSVGRYSLEQIRSLQERLKK